MFCKKQFGENLGAEEKLKYKLRIHLKKIFSLLVKANLTLCDP